MLFSLTQHGAAHGVTGSCHRLTLPDDRAVFIDCGLLQDAEASTDGDGDGAGAERLEITFDLTLVRAPVVTHVHIDHVGCIP